MELYKVGIIILNYNTWEETETCVESIIKHTSIPYKVYIVDNKSTDDSFERLKKLCQQEQIILIQAKENKGYSAGNNIGIRYAAEDGCDILFIVNSDVELLNDAFQIMAATLLKNDSYMMVGPSVQDNDGKESQIPRKKLTLRYFLLGRHPFCDIPFLAKKANRLYPITESRVFAFYGSVSGCCFGMRKKDFADMNYLDENVFLYSEEDILAYKMEDRRKKAVVDTRAKVWHKANVSTKKEGSAFVRFHRWISVLYLLKTYGKIGKRLEFLIAFWNTLTWAVLSLISKDHRKRMGEFWDKNWELVFEKKTHA